VKHITQIIKSLSEKSNQFFQEDRGSPPVPKHLPTFKKREDHLHFFSIWVGLKKVKKQNFLQKIQRR
jgi:hypothetical protein